MPHYFTSDNHKIPFEDIGKGTAILFIPGWTMSRKSFKKQLRQLSKSHRIICPDLRGQGESSKQNIEKVDLFIWATDIHELIKQLNLEKVFLVGWSLGALTMWTYCQLYGSSKLKGLVHIDMTSQLPNGWAEYKNKLIDENYQEYMTTFVKEMFLPTANSNDIQCFTNEAIKTPPTLAKRLNVIMENIDVSKTMSQAKLPTLFIFGRHSRFFSNQEQIKTSRLVPHAKTVFFENSSHCPFWEEPQRFNKLLAGFTKLNSQ